MNNNKRTFLEAVEQSISTNIRIASYSSIAGKDEAKEEIIQFILSDFKRRAEQLRDLVKNVTHETRESQNAEFLEKLIKEYSGKEEWIYDYKEGLDVYKNS
ncbi:MAG: hypothetical protein E6R13_05910 [Spirochaetes bacterium]|nr:MAG: hypothetical protein E6R13_05910 [Spirochaetota bacterium]